MSNSIMKLNIGPQNRIFQGAMKLELDVDCDLIKSCETIIGYSHKGIEKLAEDRSYLQYLPMVENIDYLSNFMYQQAFCSVVEKLGNISVPFRAEYIRVLLMELNRVSSHLSWFGYFAENVGLSAFVYNAFQERNKIFNLFEKITGKRLMCNFFKFGGVKSDISSENLEKIVIVCDEISQKVKEYDKILSQNNILCEKLQNVGILSKNNAVNCSITGPNLRASNVNLDYRKNQSLYEKLDFAVITEKGCDCFSRLIVRLREIAESLSIVKQCCDFLKNNQDEVFKNDVNPQDIKIEGIGVSYVEASRGLVSCTVIANGSDKPYRVKWRTGSFYSSQVINSILVGHNLSDVSTIVSSFDILSSEVDR